MTERSAATMSPAVARLRVTRATTAGPARMYDALEEPSWLGRVVDGTPDRPDLRRVETDLAFDLTEEHRTLTFRKAAYVDIGQPRRTTDGCVAEVSWRASTFAPLFPIFAGTVELRRGQLILEGVYAPPGGGVGLLVDRGFLRGFAQRTASWFLARVSAELESD
jgi:hypothetical protein